MSRSRTRPIFHGEMSGLQSIGGLASGLDTDSIVQKLMAIERRPKVLLVQRQRVEEARQQALKDVRTRLENLSKALAPLRDAATWTASQTVGSSDPTRLGATSTGFAAAGAFAVTVGRLARADQWRSAPVQRFAATGELRIAAGDSSVVVEIASGETLDGVADRINRASGSPVYASVVSGQLVVSGRATGAASAIGFERSDPSLLAELGLTQAIAAQDAAFSIDGVARTSPSNVVADALPGIRFALLAPVETPATVTVSAPSRGQGPAAERIQAFVDQYNSTLDFVTQKLTEKRVPNPQLDLDREKGVLSGDPSLAALLGAMRNAIADPVGSPPRQLASIGVSTGAPSAANAAGSDSVRGRLTLDRARLSAALDADADAVHTLFAARGSDYRMQGIARRLDALLDRQLERGGGLDSRLDSISTQIASAKRGQERIEARVALREKTLRARFTAMETALGQNRAQSSWLSAQIAAHERR